MGKTLRALLAPRLLKVFRCWCRCSPTPTSAVHVTPGCPTTYCLPWNSVQQRKLPCVACNCPLPYFTRYCRSESYHALPRRAVLGHNYRTNCITCSHALPYHTEPDDTINCRPVAFHISPYRPAPCFPFHKIDYRAYHTFPCRTVSPRIVYYLPVPKLATSYLSSRTTYCRAAHILPCHAAPYHILPCHAAPCHILPCHAAPCHTLPYIPCPVGKAPGIGDAEETQESPSRVHSLAIEQYQRTISHCCPVSHATDPYKTLPPRTTYFCCKKYSISRRRIVKKVTEVLLSDRPQLKRHDILSHIITSCHILSHLTTSYRIYHIFITFYHIVSHLSCG